MLNADVRVVRSDNVLWVMKGDLVHLHDFRSDRYFNPQGVSGLIWQLADGVDSVRQIAEAICREYEIDPETAEQDCLAFVQQLVELRLLEVVDEPCRS